MKQKIFTTNELRDYILKKRKTNPDYLTYCELTKGFYDILKGTKLYFGILEDYISTYDEETKSKNRKFGYDFDYAWSFDWHPYYKGKFILIKEPKEQKNAVKVKESKVKDEYYQGMFSSLKHNILLMLSQIEENLEFSKIDLEDLNDIQKKIEQIKLKNKK